MDKLLKDNNFCLHNKNYYLWTERIPPLSGSDGIAEL